MSTPYPGTPESPETNPTATEPASAPAPATAPAASWPTPPPPPPAAAYAPLPPAYPAGYPASPLRKSPLLALVLSFFPGLGQLYNGHTAKAFVFFFSFVGCLYLTVDGNPMPFALFIPFVVFYGMIDAWRSATLINLGGQEPEAVSDESPAWGLSLLAIGFVLLLNNLGWLPLASLQRFWPVVLMIAGGAFLASSLRKR